LFSFRWLRHLIAFLLGNLQQGKCFLKGHDALAGLSGRACIATMIFTIFSEKWCMMRP